jgi:hypothetical protein
MNEIVNVRHSNRGHKKPKATGSGNHNWKGGYWISDGRMRINIGNGIYRYRYQIVMEEKLGRPLQKGEIVHHINENTLDDRPENLELCTDITQHLKGKHALNRWSRNHDCCIVCGTTEIPHRANGRCQKCGRKWSWINQHN